MKYLITGANGQLGQEVSRLLEEMNEDYVACGSSDLNILDTEAIDRMFEIEKPDIVLHCAAYTAVDNAEDNESANWNVNVNGTRHVAEACKKYGATMVYISTDYVFDGESTEQYKEEDTTNPQNAYGIAKLEGEKTVQDILDNYYIVRTSWVFGQYGNNFVSTMKRLAKEKEVLTIVSDQVGRPTWTRTLAEFMVHLSINKPEYGIYHLSNDGQCSWYEFAKEILKDEKVEVKPIFSSEYPQKAKRPMHSVMDLSKAKETGFEIIRWEKALGKYLEQL